MGTVMRRTPVRIRNPSPVIVVSKWTLKGAYARVQSLFVGELKTFGL